MADTRVGAVGGMPVVELHFGLPREVGPRSETPTDSSRPRPPTPRSTPYTDAPSASAAPTHPSPSPCSTSAATAPNSHGYDPQICGESSISRARHLDHDFAAAVDTDHCPVFVRQHEDPNGTESGVPNAHRVSLTELTGTPCGRARQSSLRRCRAHESGVDRGGEAGGVRDVPQIPEIEDGRLTLTGRGQGRVSRPLVAASGHDHGDRKDDRCRREDTDENPSATAGTAVTASGEGRRLRGACSRFRPESRHRSRYLTTACQLVDRRRGNFPQRSPQGCKLLGGHRGIGILFVEVFTFVVVHLVGLLGSNRVLLQLVRRAGSSFGSQNSHELTATARDARLDGPELESEGVGDLRVVEVAEVSEHHRVAILGCHL